MPAADLLAYYARRATEYEQVYKKVERQEDLRRLRKLIPRLLAGRDVLEVACGTGYWTELIAPATRSLVATDMNEEVLAIARSKSFPPGRVNFRRADAYDLRGLPRSFTGGLAAFWWSHIPAQDLPRFFRGFHQRLVTGARVVILDNRYVEGSSTVISRTDQQGNTYQVRSLQDGSTHEVLKNFPTAGELRRVSAPFAEEIVVEELPYYWCMSYQVRR